MARLLSFLLLLLLAAVMFSQTQAAAFIPKPVCGNSLYIINQATKGASPDKCQSDADCDNIMQQHAGARATCGGVERHRGWKCNNGVHGDSCTWNGYINLDDDMNEIV